MVHFSGGRSQHITELLNLASQRHEAAIAAIEARPINPALVRAADRHLGDSMMLVEDAIDTLADAGQHSGELADALVSLQDQRDQLIAALVALEAAQRQARSSVSWLWAVVRSLRSFLSLDSFRGDIRRRKA